MSASSDQQERERPSETGSTKRWFVRPAGEADIEVLVDLRRAMFESMGCEDEAALERMTEACARYFAEAMPSGAFRAWVAEADDQVIASGGLVIHPSPPTVQNLAGQEGYIMSMFTWPEWRRQGVATAVLQAILDYLREWGVPLASLRATPVGRPLYARLGFEPVDAMHLQL